MRLLTSLAVLAAALCLAQSEVRYDGFQVIKVIPKTETQLSTLRQVENTVGLYSFWTEVTGLNQPVDILVSPQQKYDFQDLLKNLNLESSVMIEDVQVLIDQEKVPNAKSGRAYDWKSYLNLEQLNEWLNNFAAEHSDVVTVVKGGSSYERRDIVGIKISYKPGNKAVIIEGGIHAREWISPATVTYIVNQLVNSNDESVRKIAENYDWHVFPSANPDGYAYTHSTNRLWRKTRRPYGACFGADPNRNWGYKWMEGGASSSACSDTHAGPTAFSEIETKSLSEYFSSILDNTEAYIAFHSYSQLLLIPYGHRGLEVPNNDEELHTIGRKAMDVLSKRYGTQYVVGNIPEVIYVASGGSSDWALSQNRNMRLAYTYELRDKGRYGFVLPPEQIIPTGEETFDSFISLFQQISD